MVEFDGGAFHRTQPMRIWSDCCARIRHRCRGLRAGACHHLDGSRVSGGDLSRGRALLAGDGCVSVAAGRAGAQPGHRGQSIWAGNWRPRSAATRRRAARQLSRRNGIRWERGCSTGRAQVRCFDRLRPRGRWKPSSATLTIQDATAPLFPSSASGVSRADLGGGHPLVGYSVPDSRWPGPGEG